MKILLTGKNGQLGFELQRSLAPLGQLHAVGVRDVNLSDAIAIRNLVHSIQPDLIVNAAAYTAVDRAESEPELAAAINTTALEVLAKEALACGAWVIHYSTDYVFDGNKSGAYFERDSTNPQNVYGKTKLHGELALQQSGCPCLILRTSWVVGAHGRNFAKTILRLAAEREDLSVINDQYGAPTSAALLADVSAQLISRAKREGLSDFPFGLYHLAAGGETTWYQCTQFILRQALAANKTLKLKPDSIRPIATAEYPTPARRPPNSRLDTALLRNTFDLELPHWQSGLSHVLQQVLTS